jgi:hypothetical protein
MYTLLHMHKPPIAFVYGAYITTQTDVGLTPIPIQAQHILLFQHLVIPCIISNSFIRSMFLLSGTLALCCKEILFPVPLPVGRIGGR